MTHHNRSGFTGESERKRCETIKQELYFLPIITHIRRPCPTVAHHSSTSLAMCWPSTRQMRLSSLSRLFKSGPRKKIRITRTRETQHTRPPGQTVSGHSNRHPSLSPRPCQQLHGRILRLSCTTHAKSNKQEKQ